ncbi:MAG: squalene/phytoene synthase family protein [Pseudomonadota bacterium]
MQLAQELRQANRSAYLATLFVPEAVREAIAALALYGVELDRIVARAREPLAAEVRLQWWRDAIRNEGFGEDAPIPIVEALREGMDRYGWPADTLCAMSEARIHDLYSDPFPDTSAFDGYAGEVFAAPMQLAAMAVGVARFGPEDGPVAASAAAQAAGYGGVALAAADAAEGEIQRLRLGRTHIPETLWKGEGTMSLRAALTDGAVPETADEAVRAMAAHGDAADKEFRAAMDLITAPLRVALLPAFGARPVLRAVAANPLAPRLPGQLITQWRMWWDARRLAR